MSGLGQHITGGMEIVTNWKFYTVILVLSSVVLGLMLFMLDRRHDALLATINEQRRDMIALIERIDECNQKVEEADGQ